MTTVGTKNKTVRDVWIETALKALPAGLRILDAGAGEQVHKTSCEHLQYVVQDFGWYDGEGNGSGLHMGKQDYSKMGVLKNSNYACGLFWFRKSRIR